MKTYSQILIVFSALVLFNCKSTKSVKAGEANYKLSSKQLIKENLKQSPDFETLKSTLKITYTEGDDSQSYSVGYRLKKDKAIWMSATFSIVRALITPEEVSFYNKLDGTFFKGDYAYLSNLLGTTLDFQKVQNLLLGNAIFNLKDGQYQATVKDKNYVLEPKNQRDLFNILFLLDPVLFKVKSQQISQPNEHRHLEVNYVAYQKVKEQLLPKTVKVIALEGQDELSIGLEFKNVVLNEDLRLPFKIPSGFKPIEL